MSRIGRQPIEIPAGVTITITGEVVRVEGPKGQQELRLMPGIGAKQENGVLTIERTATTPETQKAYGLMRTLIHNMVVGVSTGFTRQLEINGVGFRASVAGQTITLGLGFSHPVIFELPEGISATVERNLITVAGADKQQVGQVAADLRALKKPEPYKGKGIKYTDEHIRRKAGKTAAKG